MARRDRNPKPATAYDADQLRRGIAGRVMAADTYRNLRLEVVQAQLPDGTETLECHVAGIPLGVLADGGHPEDQLTKLRTLADAVHASAGNPGDDDGQL